MGRYAKLFRQTLSVLLMPIDGPRRESELAAGPRANPQRLLAQGGAERAADFASRFSTRGARKSILEHSET